MDGENHGKPYYSMDDLGGKNSIFGNIHLESHMVEGLAKVYIAKHFWQD